MREGDTIIAIRDRRPPLDRIPQTKEQRDRLLSIARAYVKEHKLIGPLSLAELRKHSAGIIRRAKLNPKYRDYAAILLNNSVWRDTVGRIPCNRRLLLLPKCLRSEEKCQAHFDELGLICEHCGSCLIDELKSQAEQLGYAVLVAEGSPVVISLIESGKIDAVIGVSCISVLEQAFPYMESGAIPGIAIPLLQDGCAHTSVDVDWVWEAIYENSDELSQRLNLEKLRKLVEDCFTKDSLLRLMGKPGSQTERLALEWMAKAGKRWRPYLAVCAYHALAGKEEEEELSQDLLSIAVAVECFHKASLIHDDIEDGDSTRYGEKTLHTEYGVPIALNVGDFLVGEGYRLLAGVRGAADRISRMLRVAAEGHRNLCLGQGNELSWMRNPGPLRISEVIDIFQKKTAPAFEVALKLGAIFADGGEPLGGVLKQYSQALGVAYQIRDDIQDFEARTDPSDLKAKRPSLLLALAHELADGQDKALLERVWKQCVDYEDVEQEVLSIFESLKIKRVVLDLMESYKTRAISSLVRVENSALKGLLRRVVGKIFNDMEGLICCHEYKAGYAAGGDAGEEPAG